MAISAYIDLLYIYGESQRPHTILNCYKLQIKTEKYCKCITVIQNKIVLLIIYVFLFVFYCIL